MPHLDQWMVVCHPGESPYRAPETKTRHLTGLCADHPAAPTAGMKDVCTSQILILKTEERFARTLSGREYTLGEPNPVWLSWLTEKGYKLEDFNKPRK